MSLSGAETITITGASNRGFTVGVVTGTFNVTLVDDPLEQVGEEQEGAGYSLSGSYLWRDLFIVKFYPASLKYNTENPLNYSSKRVLYDILRKPNRRIDSCTFEQFDDEDNYPNSAALFPVVVVPRSIDISSDEESMVQEITVTFAAREVRR